MRLIIAVCIWFLLVGGLFAYMHEREKGSTAEHYELREATASFTLEITPTFSAEPDPFALQSDTGKKASAIVLKLNIPFATIRPPV